MLITEEEKQSRAQIVKESIYSVELEGLIVPQGQLDNFDDYINGKVTMTELGERTKAMYGGAAKLQTSKSKYQLAMMDKI